MNDRDFAKLAASARRFAELCDDRGMKSLKVAADWKRLSRPDAGIGSPDVEPVAPDKRDKLDRMRHERLLAVFGRTSADLATGIALMLDTCPRAPDQSDDCPEGACRNCWTDKRYYEPVSHYGNSCRWCGDFRNTEGRYPPLPLLRKRHAQRRITTTDVDKALGRAG